MTKHGEDLISAAFAYLEETVIWQDSGTDFGGYPPDIWPWSKEDWKPEGTVRNLEKAGALIAAAIDAIKAEEGK